jgi:hypothetical protein
MNILHIDCSPRLVQEQAAQLRASLIATIEPLMANLACNAERMHRSTAIVMRGTTISRRLNLRAPALLPV